MRGARERAVLEGLAPRGLAERLRARVAGGWTAAQVWERLTDRGPFAGDGTRAVDAVHAVLVALTGTGEVERARVRWTARLNTKGHRDMVVDVFRLR